MELFDSTELNELWKMTSYEVKCEFINNYIDTIVIKELKNKRNKITEIEITDLKLKSNKVKQLLNFEDSNMLDKIVGSGVYKASIAEMKHEKDALEYIELLQGKYDFDVVDYLDEEDYFVNPWLFKIIKVNQKFLVYGY